jgi:hypothetical protein
MLPNGDWDAYSISPNMNHTEGAEDAEIHALTFGLKHGLRQADTRFTSGVYVYRIVAYLDPMFWLVHLSETHFRPGSSRNIIRELYRVARLIEEAGIELLMCWVPKVAKIRPHVIADQLVVEHQNVARVCYFLILRFS